MKSFPFEQYIGINNFLTNQAGIGGLLRHTADDFVVDEQLDNENTGDNENV